MNTKPVILTLDEIAAYQAAIVKSIKLIAMYSEGSETNNYPVITELCSLYQKMDE